MRGLFYVFALSSAIAAFTIACVFGARGNWVVVAAVPVIVSPVLMWFIRQVWEGGEPEGMFNPATQSWAFMFGDSLALPLALGAAAISWHTIDSDSWFRSPTWLIVSLFFGIALACIWHFVLDGPGYTELGYADLLGSPTKIWHDFTVYASLGGALCYLGIPALAKDFTGVGWVALIGLVLWGVLGLLFDNVLRELDPADLHPKVQDTRLAQ